MWSPAVWAAFDDAVDLNPNAARTKRRHHHSRPFEVGVVESLERERHSCPRVARRVHRRLFGPAATDGRGEQGDGRKQHDATASSWLDRPAHPQLGTPTPSGETARFKTDSDER